MISVAIKYPLLFLMAIVIAGVVDEILAKLGIPPLGGFIGGFLIGIFFEKPNILYGTLCGFFYIALIATVLIAIGLGSKLSIDDVLHKLFLDIALLDIFKLFLVLAAFTFGTWVGKVVKKSWRKSGKGQ